MADLEIEAWKAQAEKSEFSLFFITAKLHARAVPVYLVASRSAARFYESRMRISVGEMANRAFERALPDLEAVAAIEQSWTKKNFEPAKAARARLNWWRRAGCRGRTRRRHVGQLMADDYALRYGVGQDRVAGFAEYMVRRDGDCATSDAAQPDWNEIQKMVLEVLPGAQSRGQP